MARVGGRGVAIYNARQGHDMTGVGEIAMSVTYDGVLGSQSDDRIVGDNYRPWISNHQPGRADRAPNSGHGDTLCRSAGYPVDADRRKLTETDLAASQAQGFGYDDASRLTSWNRSGSTPSTQSWNLSLVGDWNSTTRDGVAESRTNTAVHEAVQVGSAALAYDPKGNLTQDERGTALAWDPENRMTRAVIPSAVSPSSFGAIATMRYDALGRRVAKTVQNRQTLYINAGAQTVVEIDSAAVRSQTDITGAAADGTLANMALTPASGGILAGGNITRINFQPAPTLIPAGYLADSGKVLPDVGQTRTNGLVYGWDSDVSTQAVARDAAALVEWDTFIQAQTDATSASWSIALPDGTYPVVVVAGDALSRNQTNSLLIAGQCKDDDTPATTEVGYNAGNFDGYAVQANVTNGILTIAPDPNALHPAFHAKLCFIEIGVKDAIVDQTIKDKLTALVKRMNDQTANTTPPINQTREFAYGSYVDEVVAYQQTVGGVTTRYYPHYNHLYSVAALTNAAGQVVERFTYNAYGKQTITSATGVVRQKSAVGWDRGFTGYIADNETGLAYARSRMYSPTLGRFVNRDSLGYVDGTSLYGSYFVPNGLDPLGLSDLAKCIEKATKALQTAMKLAMARLQVDIGFAEVTAAENRKVEVYQKSANTALVALATIPVGGAAGMIANYAKAGVNAYRLAQAEAIVAANAGAMGASGSLMVLTASERLAWAMQAAATLDRVAQGLPIVAGVAAGMIPGACAT